MLFHLNCVVALELMFGISEAMVNCGWEDIAPERTDEDLSLLDIEREGKALNAISLTTGASPEGLLVNLGDERWATFGSFCPALWRVRYCSRSTLRARLPDGGIKSSLYSQRGSRKRLKFSAWQMS
jgi:hypothetical protein